MIEDKMATDDRNQIADEVNSLNSVPVAYILLHVSIPVILILYMD